MRYVLAAILSVLTVVVRASVFVPTAGGISEGLVDVIGVGIFGALFWAALFCIPTGHRNLASLARNYNVALLLLLAPSLLAAAKIFGAPSKTLTGKQGLVEIGVPGTWEETRMAKPGLLLALKNRTGTVMTLIGTDPDVAQSTDIEVHVRDIAGALADGQGIKSRSDLMHCDVEGMDCRYQELVVEDGDGGMQHVVATLKSSRRLYNFIAVTNPPLYQRHKEEIFEVLSSIRELDASAAALKITGTPH